MLDTNTRREIRIGSSDLSPANILITENTNTKTDMQALTAHEAVEVSSSCVLLEKARAF